MSLQKDKKATREPFIMVVVGMQKVGKTYTTLERLQDYVKSRNVLIFDSVIDKSLDGVKTIDYDCSIVDQQARCAQVINLSRLRVPDIRKVVALRKNGSGMSLEEKKQTAIDLINNFRNGLLLLDDYNNYVVATRAGAIIGPITTVRHRNLDLIIHLQHIGAIDGKLWQNLAYVRMHKMNSSIDNFEKKIPDFFIFKVAELIIDKYYAIGHIRKSLLVDIISRKIIGAKKEDLKEALTKYAALKRKEIAKYGALNAIKKPLDAQKAWVEDHTKLFYLSS